MDEQVIRNEECLFTLWNLNVRNIYMKAGNLESQVTLSMTSWNSKDSAMDSPSRCEDGSCSWSPLSPSTLSVSENYFGKLIVKILKGVDLAVRDVLCSDPYVVLKMGKQECKTQVIKNDLNPVWDKALEFKVSDPNLPITMAVYDYDKFTKDDKMGEAEIDIRPFIDALRMNLDDYPSGTIITKLTPSRQNCLAEESHIVWEYGKVAQSMCIRLKNVESGEIELQLQWTTDFPGSIGL